MPDITYGEWLRRAKTLEVAGGHHIDGAEHPGGGASYPVVSPRDGQAVTEVADGGTAEVDAAVVSARRALDTGPWPRLTPAERGRVLVRIAELLEEGRQLLALAVSLEMGKPITDAHDNELRAAITTFRWYGQLADKLWSLAALRLPARPPEQGSRAPLRGFVDEVTAVIPQEVPAACLRLAAAARQ